MPRPREVQTPQSLRLSRHLCRTKSAAHGSGRGPCLERFYRETFLAWTGKKGPPDSNLSLSSLEDSLSATERSEFGEVAGVIQTCAENMVHNVTHDVSTRMTL